jgi:hypothetical protein
MTGYTAFVTYILVPDTLTNLISQAQSEIVYGGNITIPPTPPVDIGVGNSKYIHCNYIHKIVLNTTMPKMNEISFSFDNVDDFKFLSGDVYNGTGFTANKIYALIQLVDNSGFDTLDDVVPSPSEWKKFNITNQITTYSLGDYITPDMLLLQVFRIPLINYDYYDTYNISDYIQYPTKQSTDDDELCFGEEEFFFGNVSTDIKAIGYTTDIAINLGLNEFNSSNNKTWNGIEPVVISEVGVYDNEYNLVAMGKLNNPIPKDSTIARTIVFDVDF